jgi:Leucine-rich repeat (LRR) protein
LLNPKEFLDEIIDVNCMTLEVLQLGIINLTIVDLRRMFKEIFNAFPKMDKLTFKIQYLSEKGPI